MVISRAVWGTMDWKWKFSRAVGEPWIESGSLVELLGNHGLKVAV